MPDPFSLWWLVVPIGVIFVGGAAVGAAVAFAYLTRVVDEPSNVLVLPPCAHRSGPTHVVTRPRLYDYDREPA